MSFIVKFTGLDHLHQDSRLVMKRFIAFSILLAILDGLVPVVFTLHLIDNIGYLKTGQFMAVLIAVQFLIDYPSGSLGDRIGYKWVLFMSKIGSAIGFLIFAFADSFSQFLFSAVIFGFSDAQSSGALEAWIDNNYKTLSGEIDKERKNYGFTRGRLNSLTNFVMGVSIMLGGIIATVYSRKILFLSQIALNVILAFLFVLFLNNYYKKAEMTNENVNLLLTLGNGLKVAFSQRSISFFLIGNAIMMTIWSIWGALILFPLYFSYSGTDAGTSLLRSIIFFLSVIVSIKLVSFSRRIENDKLPRLYLSQVILLFSSVILLLNLYPPTYKFTGLGLFLVILIFTICVSSISPLIFTLTQRITLDLIPSENRNSIYSLMPTLAAPLQIVGIPIVGSIIEKNGLDVGVLLILFLSLIGILFLHLSILASSKEKSYILDYSRSNNVTELPAIGN